MGNERIELCRRRVHTSHSVTPAGCMLRNFCKHTCTLTNSSNSSQTMNGLSTSEACSTRSTRAALMEHPPSRTHKAVKSIRVRAIFSIVRGITPAATPLHVCAIAPKLGHGACEATPRQTMEGKFIKWTGMPQYCSPQGRTHSYGSRRVPDAASRAKQRRWLVHKMSACLCTFPNNSKDHHNLHHIMQAYTYRPVAYPALNLHESETRCNHS